MRDLSRRLAVLEKNRPCRRLPEWNANLAAEVRRIMTDSGQPDRAAALAAKRPNLIPWAWQSCFAAPDKEDGHA